MDAKIKALHEAFANNIGNRLTPELAYGILQTVLSATEDRSLNPAAFAPQEYGPYTLQVEHIRDNLDAARTLHQMYWAEAEEDGEFNANYQKLGELERLGMYVFITARLNGSLVGQLGGYIQESPITGRLTATDNLLYVLPEHRVGVGRALMKYGVEKMFEMGVSDIESATPPDNRNQAVLKRLGFRHVANKYILSR